MATPILSSPRRLPTRYAGPVAPIAPSAPQAAPTGSGVAPVASVAPMAAVAPLATDLQALACTLGQGLLGLGSWLLGMLNKGLTWLNSRTVPAAPAPTPAPAPGGAPGSPWQPGPGRLEGADTSHYQSDATFQATIQGRQWTAIKATQGTTYTDPTFQARWNQLGQAVQRGQMKLRVAYCYLNTGDGAAQAKHFLQTLGVNGPLPAGTRLALDWEGAALNSPATLQQAATYIHQVTGIWPLIYVQGSKMAVAKQAVPQAPIWEAAWSATINPNVPFFQYSNGPGYDHDVFNGDLKALERFAGWA